MKKVLFGLFCVTLLAGCEDEVELSKEQVKMQELVNSYYEAHLKGAEELEEVVITISDFKIINSINQTYDLKDLENCKDTSSVTIKVDNSLKKINEYIFNMECE